MDQRCDIPAPARAPRYTSYPTALAFESVGEAEFRARLREVGLYEPLSLYLHMPFCRSMCWYCGCNMKVENAYPRALRYLDAVKREARLVAEALAGAGRPSALHLGGGTPNYFRPEDLADLVRTIESEFGLTDSVKLAIEIDPRLLQDGDAAALVAAGFSRFSLGVQDFDDDVQRAINRVQSFDLVAGAVGALRAAGVDDISFDVMYGLPRQTEATFADTIEKVIALAPDRIAVFGYAHAPAALKRQRLISADTLPAGPARLALATQADECLMGAGYVRIGFDHYARPENALALAAREKRVRRNFQGFTDDLAETTIGLGASAISFVHGLYAQNVKSVVDYQNVVARGALPIARGKARTRRDDVIARTISTLLCAMETDIRPLLNVATPAEAVQVTSGLSRLEQIGHIRWRGDHIAVEEGRHYFARIVAAALDLNFGADGAFSLAV